MKMEELQDDVLVLKMAVNRLDSQIAALTARLDRCEKAWDAWLNFDGHGPALETRIRAILAPAQAEPERIEVVQTTDGLWNVIRDFEYHDGACWRQDGVDPALGSFTKDIALAIAGVLTEREKANANTR